MKNVSPTMITLVCLVGLCLLFGRPGKQVLVARDTTIIDKCLYGDHWVPSIKKTLDESRPELVLIGNSMLGEAVDQEQLATHLGIGAAKVWMSGGTSAWWYLAIKNVILALDYKPEYVGIFFRDNFLTLPHYKVEGKNKRWIDNLAGPDEAVLDDLAYVASMSPLERPLHSYLPVYNKRDLYQEKTLVELRRTTSKLIGEEDYHAVDRMFERTFANKRMVQRLMHEREVSDDLIQQREQQDLTFSPQKTFLPEIIALLRNHDIKVFFVRIKRLRDLNPGAQPEELERYMVDLNAFLKGLGVPLLDFTNETNLKKEHYGSGDHLNRGDGRRLFTKLLAERIERMVGNDLAYVPGAMKSL